jgi:hypothetical protein
MCALIGILDFRMAKKNAAAQALAALRMKRMTAEERAEVAAKGGEASTAKLTPAQLKKRASDAAKARWDKKRARR